MERPMDPAISIATLMPSTGRKILRPYVYLAELLLAVPVRAPRRRIPKGRRSPLGRGSRGAAAP